MGAAGSGATDGGLLGARGVCLRVSGVVSCGRVSVRIRADYRIILSGVYAVTPGRSCQSQRVLCMTKYEKGLF